MKDKIPEFLINLLINQYGDELTKKIIEGYSKKRIVSIRVNTIKASKNEIESKLKMNNIDYSISDFYEHAFIIKNVNENKIEELEIFKEGKIYMQSLSSMLPPIILDTKENEDILDMTAAPGGKTTQIAALTNNNAHITACEMNNVRLERLKYNVEKQGATSVYVMKQDSRRIDDFFSFDKILLDAPCSGSGTLNVEDENLQKYFTETLIEKSKKAQLELLKKAIKILKPGHEMVYSTCSILKEENEEIIKKAIQGTNVKIVPIEFKGKDKLPLLPTKINGTICVMPTELYEGFFVAKLVKQ